MSSWGQSLQCEKSQQVRRKKRFFRLNAIQRQVWSSVSLKTFLSECRRNSHWSSVSNLHSFPVLSYQPLNRGRRQTSCGNSAEEMAFARRSWQKKGLTKSTTYSIFICFHSVPGLILESVNYSYSILSSFCFPYHNWRMWLKLNESISLLHSITIKCLIKVIILCHTLQTFVTFLI